MPIQCEMRIISAKDNIYGYQTSEERDMAIGRVAKMSLTEMGNLPAKVIVCIGKLYMITVNIDVIDGLVNGMYGWEPLVH